MIFRAINGRGCHALKNFSNSWIRVDSIWGDSIKMTAGQLDRELSAFHNIHETRTYPINRSMIRWGDSRRCFNKSLDGSDLRYDGRDFLGANF